MSKVLDPREVPTGLGISGRLVSAPSNIEMPTLAYLRGYELRLVQMQRGTGDPYVLYDRWGHIVYQWPEGYTPRWVDILEVIR